MVAHKWWRVVFAGSQGGTYIQFAELAFLDASGNDLSTGGAPSASSEYSGGYSAIYAFDKSSSTDWCTQAGAWPAWLGYQHPGAVDVQGFRIKASSNADWLPRTSRDLALQYSDNGITWMDALPSDDHELYVHSGSFSAYALVEVRIREKEPLLTGLVGLGTGPGWDWRMPGETNGTITDNNRVMVKPEPTAPEVPYAGARVRLHRLLDGYCAWEGISDAQGWYWPRGLEVGLWYYPVAIDLTGTHECDAAGPVQAVREGG